MMDLDNEDYFDFNTVDELPEESFPEKKSCLHCGKSIPADNLFCLFCGEETQPKRKGNWLILVALFILIAALLFWLFYYD